MNQPETHGGANAMGRTQFADDKKPAVPAGGAIPPHETETDTTTPPKAANPEKLDPTPENLAGAHAFQDPNGDPSDPSSFKFPHHNVNDDGTPGPANIKAVQDAKDDVKKDPTLSDDDKAGVAAHLDKHLADADVPTDAADDPDNADDDTAPKVFPPGGGADDKSFSMPIMVIEGSWTGDWRYIAPQSLSWRDLPLPVMVLTSTTPTHDGAQLVGQITSIERHEFVDGTVDSRTGKAYAPGTSYLSGVGKFDSSTVAQETQRLVAEGFLRGVSVDIGDAISEIAMVDADGNDVEQDDDDWDLFDLLFGFTAAADAPAEEDPEGDDAETKDAPVYFGERIISGRLMGATICPFPAFEGAYVVIGDTAMAASAFSPTESGPGVNYVAAPSVRNSIVAAGGPVKPPAKWFNDPAFTEPTAIRVTDDGRMFGHLATWTECHIGYTNSCVMAPHSRSDYAYFRVGYVLTSDGSEVPTGVISMNTGHAELWQGADSAKAHYDNTGLAVADVCCGEDEFGVWVSGAVRPDVDEMTVRRLRGAALSGDWRQVGGQLELVAALAVNVPGFPITRPKSRVASGAPVALVAAGRLTQKDAERLHGLASRKDEPKMATVKPDKNWETLTTVLERQARQALRKEVHTASTR